MAQEYLQYAGQVIIDSILLVSGDRSTKLDIRYLFDEINITEDIFSSAMTGEMRMLDSFNLPSTFPILGEEILVFEAHTPTFESVIKKNFSVTGIGDKVIGGSKNVVYTINFTSIESVVDLNLRVTTAFSGKPTDSAVALFKKFFPSSKIRVEPCSNTIKLVAPTVSPFTMMNIFANKAMSTNNFAEPNYLFYEDNQQFNMVSLSALFSQKPVTTFRWSYSQMRVQDETGESTRDINAEYANVKQEPYIDNVFNTMEATLNGAMGHRVFEVDVVRKTVNKRTYSYLDDFSKTKHLNSYPTNTENFAHTSNAVIETVLVHPNHQGTFRDRDGEIGVKRNSMLAACEFIKMDITVNGRTNLKVGDVIAFEMGKFSTGDNDKFSATDALDPYYSGNYLIGAIRHRFSQQRHDCTMQIFKESFPNKIGTQ